MITIKHRGDFSKTKKFLHYIFRVDYKRILNRYGMKGCLLLAEATPIDSGETAASWTYEIEKTDSGYSIVWSNSNVVRGMNIAILLQYGHGTGTGGYVMGRDYINPALQPVFDEMAQSVWRELIKQ